MGTLSINISVSGVNDAIEMLNILDEKIQNALENKLPEAVQELAKATEDAWRGATPVRTGRLKGDDTAIVDGLKFTLENSVFYYDFVDQGHMTAKGWNTRHGFRPAKRRSHVGGRFMTNVAVDFVRANITEYLESIFSDL